MVDTHITNNFTEWLPVNEGQSVLYVSEKMDNLSGNYDFLIVTDAFGKVRMHFSGNSPYADALKLLKAHLNPGGHVILAVDNKYGLSFFAGCPEQLTGRYFEGLEGYPHTEGIRTFSKEAVLEMAAEAGFTSVKTYYPYPDYRYMTEMYSDEKLPLPGELKTDFCNFEQERVVLFDEAKVFDGLIREGRFAEFSNSYLFDLTVEKTPGEELLYLKYSVERDERFRIRTEIIKKADGTRVVRKVPVGDQSVVHVRNMKHWENVLKDRYEPAGIFVNRCTLTEKGAEFEFLHGETLEAKLDELLEKREFPEMISQMQEFADCLMAVSQPKPFESGERFREIFGDVNFPRAQQAAEVNNIDWIFSNVMVVNDQWHIIDYEWTFDFPIPVKFMIYRAISLYCQAKKREVLKGMELYRMFDISVEEEEIFEKMEHSLQLYLLGGTKTMAQLRREYAGKVISFEELMKKAHQQEMKVYLDYGEGFSEMHSFVLEVPEDYYGRRRFHIPLPQGVRAVRLDPCEEACMVSCNRILGECNGSYEPAVSHNGRSYEKSILFTSSDPQLILTGIVPGSSQIHVDVTVEYPGEESIYVWMKMLEKAEKCDRILASKPYRMMKKLKDLLKKGSNE
ncbi:MAG: hypothetical protein ACI4DV_01520 [Lachnospiraceae bacterium]